MCLCWFLVGMPGSGKSSIGRALAERTERVFLDTDSLIEQRLGRRIADVFRVYGEAAFRDHETSVLRSLEPHGCVVATGGGIVLREANWAEMHRLGVVAFLDVSEEVLAARLEAARRKRPLLAHDDWRARLTELRTARHPLYLRADCRLPILDLDVASSAELAERELRAAERARTPHEPR